MSLIRLSCPVCSQRLHVYNHELEKAKEENAKLLAEIIRLKLQTKKDQNRLYPSYGLAVLRD